MAYLKKIIPAPSVEVDAFYLEADHLAFKDMFDHASDAMLVKRGSDLSHYYVNRNACKMTGYSFGELLNMGFKDLIHPEELGKIEERWKMQRKGMDLPGCYETRIITKNGDIIPVAVTVTRCRRGNHGLSFAVLRDIRKEKHLKNEMNKNLHMLKEELMRSRAEWESLNRELVQTHQAMSVLAKNIESKKDELEKKLNTTITSKVMPIIKELLAEERAKRFWPEISSMAEHLNGITTKSDLLLKAVSMLTETELKIAAMVKNKMSTKEIATLMYISVETVKSHRKNIRTKLNIQNTKQKLSECLAMVMGQ